MKYTTATVNETGLAEIKEFLSQNHKKGGDHFTREMLSAWASEAEFQVGEGNPPTIELHARDSVHGRTQEYTISPAGIDEVEYDDFASLLAAVVCKEYQQEVDAVLSR